MSESGFLLVPTAEARRVLGVDHRQLAALTKVETVTRRWPDGKVERSIKIPVWLLERAQRP